MLRRSLLAVAVALMPGCGLAMKTMAERPHLFVWSESRTHPEPTHRVALATLEAMRAELASADFARDDGSQFAVASGLMQPGMKIPKPGEAVPPDYPAFWLDWTASNNGHRERQLVQLQLARFEGVTRDGRRVQVGVRKEPESTQVMIQVDKHGDAKLGKALLDRIDDRLAHPLHPPGSSEEGETLRAFFGGVDSREAIPSLRKPTPGPPG